jgi:hypothetical protein
MPLILTSTVDTPSIPVVSLKEYLSQDRVLVIPPWQREYSWSTSEDEQVDTLLKDLLKFIRNPSSEEYLIGSVVLCTLPGEEKRPLLIDGQQRTLTLTLLLMCCQKYLKTFSLIDGNDNGDTQLNSELISCINGNAYGMLKARVEMKRSDADVTLRELYDWSTLPGEFDKKVFQIILFLLAYFVAYQNIQLIYPILIFLESNASRTASPVKISKLKSTDIEKNAVSPNHGA